MRSAAIVGIAIGMSCISGCAAFHDWTQQSSFGMAAADLDPDLVSYKTMLNPGSGLPVTPPSDTNKNYLGLVVKDSESKCSEFINHLVLAETTNNAGLDIVSTVFSALGTVFTPINTVHILTAGATIASGSKTAIDSDIFAKATVSNYAQAIQATYYTDIGNYMSALSNSSSDSLVPSIEVAKIVAIHKECSLASAQSTISQTLQTAANPSATQNATTTVAVTSLPPGGTALSVIANSSLLPASKVEVDYSTTTTDTSVALVAQHLASAISGNPSLKGAGISATSSGNSVLITWPSSLDIDWKTSAYLVIVTGQAATSGAQGGNSVTQGGTSTAQGGTPTGHPGRAILLK
jgi:hypothetical protein